MKFDIEDWSVIIGVLLLFILCFLLLAFSGCTSPQYKGQANVFDANGNLLYHYEVETNQPMHFYAEDNGVIIECDSRTRAFIDQLLFDIGLGNSGNGYYE